MTKRFEGKVVLISGAARGQGRSHAVSFALEGAAVLAFDISAPVQAQGAPPATPEDLQETENLVRSAGGHIITAIVDSADFSQVSDFVRSGTQELGPIDIVLANAGINGPGVKMAVTDPADWNSVIDVNLNGSFNTIRAALPGMIEADRGGSIVITSSSLALRAAEHFGAYTAAKHGLIGLMRTLAIELGPRNIRVNTVHPTGVNTDLLVNDATFRLFRPDLADPTLEDVLPSYQGLNALPTPWIEASDVSELVLFLASDAARFITGGTFAVDAGMSLL